MLYKKILSVIVISLLCVSSAWGHPLDISISTGTFSGNKMNITTYFHSYEIDYLLQKDHGGKNMYSVEDYFLYEKTITDYVRKQSHLENNGVVCRLDTIELIEDEAYSILSDGLGVSYSFMCDKNIEKISLSLDYFLEFPLQTNRITLYDFSQGIGNSQAIIYKVLTPKISVLSLDVQNEETIVSLDSDNDGLSDEDEKIYATDPNNPDTDGDFFSDSEEIDYGWDPLSSQMGP